MTAPRPVLPNTTYLLTRSCTQRQFLLRPDAETNNAFLYCLIEAATRYGIEVVVSQMMSNHHHTVIYDRDGKVNEFITHFHRMVAQCQNTLRGRSENMWSTDEPSVVELVEPGDVMAKLEYVATNPVKDGLVALVDEWPGPKIVQALLSGTKLRATRPTYFFRADGSMPAVVEMDLTIPPQLGDKDSVILDLRQRIADYEKAQTKARLADRTKVLGRSGVLNQSWRSSPSTTRPRRELRPRIAAKDEDARISTLEFRAAFAASYELARQALLAGDPIPFPAGTYWLRRFANVPVASAPLR